MSPSCTMLQENGMTWDVVTGLFSADPDGRDIGEGAFEAGLRCLHPTDFTLTHVRIENRVKCAVTSARQVITAPSACIHMQADLQQLARRFTPDAGSGKAAGGGSGRKPGRLVSLHKLRDFAFSIPHVGWKAELTRFRAAKEAAAGEASKPKSPKASAPPSSAPKAPGSGKVQRPPPVPPVGKNSSSTARTTRPALLRRSSSNISSTSATSTTNAATARSSTSASINNPSRHAMPTMASSRRGQELQRSNLSTCSVARTGPAAAPSAPQLARQKSDVEPLPKRRLSGSKTNDTNNPVTMKPPDPAPKELPPPAALVPLRPLAEATKLLWRQQQLLRVRFDSHDNAHRLIAIVARNEDTGQVRTSYFQVSSLG